MTLRASIKKNATAYCYIREQDDVTQFYIRTFYNVKQSYDLHTTNIWYQNTISSISTSYPSLHIYQIPDTRYQIPDTIHHRYNILHHRYNIYYLSNTHVFITPMPIATRTIKYYSAVRSTIPLSQCLFTVDKLMLNFLAVCD